MNDESRTVTFHPLGKSTEAKPDETLLDAARRAAVPIGTSCGSIGVCARCRVTVVAGADNLAPPTSIEIRVAERRKLEPDERLACQAVVNGPCTITATYW